jgi:hypothetical protein
MVSGLDGFVDPSAALEVVATGATWSEGPLWMRARGRLRWSDIPNDRICEYARATGAVADHAGAWSSARTVGARPSGVRVSTIVASTFVISSIGVVLGACVGGAFLEKDSHICCRPSRLFSAAAH